MCDEYPRVNPAFCGPNPYAGTLEAGMVIGVQSYVGVDDGVNLEQWVLVTERDYELVSTYPLEENLLS
jgi:Xaa-Pro aminopeptidase